jgi:bifunctional ADP-heptose synthase (sugar kinase/adenylyltransferase)
MIKGLGAKIVSFEEFEDLRPKLGKIVATSGGFDPIHPGHISCIIESKRSLIVSGIREVDYVVPFEIKNDQTVSKALAALKPDVFTKGGDRQDKASLPEWNTCQENNIKIEFNVGHDKKWSSSWFLKEWDEKNNGKN